jgi:RHS repeat-associated protein
VTYELGDHLGSVAVVLDATGALVNREEFTPYGETSFGSYAKKRYRFTGKERDEESSYNYHGARYYAPWKARWISPDPIGLGDGPHLYAYARGNPVMLVDPTGREGKYTKQMNLSQAPAYSQPVMATKAGRGYGATLRQNYQKTALMWGLEGEVHVGHLKPFVLTPALEVGMTFVQLASENLSQSASEKAAAAGAGATGQFRRINDIDVGAQSGVRRKQPPMNAAFRSAAFKNWKAVAPPRPSGPAPVVPSPPAPHVGGQLELPFHKPAAPPAAPPPVTPPPVAAPPAASRWSQLKGGLYRVAGVAEGAGRLAAYASTLQGAHNEGARSFEFERSHHRGPLNEAAMYLATGVAAIYAGAIDDMLFAATAHLSGAPVMESWERYGSGPVQHLAGEAIRGYLEMTFQHGW